MALVGDGNTPRIHTFPPLHLYLHPTSQRLPLLLRTCVFDSYLYYFGLRLPGSHYGVYKFCCLNAISGICYLLENTRLLIPEVCKLWPLSDQPLLPACLPWSLPPSVPFSLDIFEAECLCSPGWLHYVEWAWPACLCLCLHVWLSSPSLFPVFRPSWKPVHMEVCHLAFVPVPCVCRSVWLLVLRDSRAFHSLRHNPGTLCNGSYILSTWDAWGLLHFGDLRLN